MLRKPITEFLQQCGVGVENVRHALETLGTPLTIFCSSRSSLIAKALVPKYAKR
jgi:hypothetical protein